MQQSNTEQWVIELSDDELCDYLGKLEWAAPHIMIDHATKELIKRFKWKAMELKAERQFGDM